MKPVSQPGMTRKGKALETFVISLSDEDAKRKGNTWRVLRNKSSLRIIFVLSHYEDQLCVSEIAKVLNKSLATISNQLKHLYEGGFVTWDDHGTYRYYRLRYETLAVYANLLEGVLPHPE